MNIRQFQDVLIPLYNATAATVATVSAAVVATAAVAPITSTIVNPVVPVPPLISHKVFHLLRLTKTRS